MDTDRKPSPRPRLARMLQQWRDERGISQQTLAADCGLSRNYISLIEQGKATNLSVSVICSLAIIMGIDAVEVFRWACIEEVPEDVQWYQTCDTEWLG